MSESSESTATGRTPPTGMGEVTARLGGLAYGGDYNPEQWPEEVWAQDAALMQEAGVTLATVGVFSWALLQPEPERWDLAWLDRVLDLLHEHGIAVDLATATASPPPWFTTAHPEAALVDEHGVVRAHGARQAYCPSSPAFRDASARLVTALAERYAEHPAVVMWHVSNEYACHNWHCYCEVSAEAFRAWLRERHGSLERLNQSWGTAFWSQHYGDWEEVLPPRAVSYHSFANPGQQLDWWRFSSGEHQRMLRHETEILHRLAPQPVTTNFMSFFKPLDYWSMARDVDLVTNDDYLIAADPDPAQRTAMSADLMRCLAQGEPWLLMEHSTSAVNWQPRNVPKPPGGLRRTSLSHVARGSDGAMFFQWRASRIGAEKFHSAMLPHGGTDTKVWRETVELGQHLGRLAEVAGSRVQTPSVAVVHDWEAWWAGELDSHPSADVTPATPLRRWYGALWDRGVGVDFVHPGGPLEGYDLVVVPGQYLVTDAHAEALTAYVAGGGTAVVTYFSGIVDEHDAIRLGGYPGAYRDLLGLRVEEFAPLLEGGSVRLSDGTVGTVWSEYGRATSADVVAAYAEGGVAGSPAVAVNAHGGGRAWYVGTELEEDGFAALVDRLLQESGVQPTVPGLPRGVDAVRRVARPGDGPSDGPGRSWVFLVNNGDADAVVPLAGTDLLRGDGTVTPSTTVRAGDATVVLEAREDVEEA